MSAIDVASAFVAAHEGCRLTAYRDSTGVLTLGYGHTGPEVVEGLT
jgi:lysozyme